MCCIYVCVNVRFGWSKNLFWWQIVGVELVCFVCICLFVVKGLYEMDIWIVILDGRVKVNKDIRGETESI